MVRSNVCLLPLLLRVEHPPQMSPRYNLDNEFRKITNRYKLSTPLMSAPSLLTTHYSSPTSSWQPPTNMEVESFCVVPSPEHTRKIYIRDYLIKKRQEMSRVRRHNTNNFVLRPF